jgi:soluble lytic murein transglycosylase-like protein
LAGPVLAQGGVVYQSGTESNDGEAVNVYTNAGAQRYRQAMQTSGGVIHNTIQKEDPALSSAALMPKAYSYDESGYRTGRRLIGQADLSELIDKEARKNGIDPLILEIIIRHESNFNPSAVSPTGAMGLMQLMPGTASSCGVKDPFDPAQNVAGGAYYFAQQLRRFQDLSQALAAYNAGPAAVQTYGGIPPFAETQNYVSSICMEYTNRRKRASKPDTSKPE